MDTIKTMKNDGVKATIVDKPEMKRNLGLDLLKIVACFLVVVIHTASPFGFTSVLYYAAVVAIPIFFMVNGFLLFGKTAKDRWYSYKKIVRILLLVFVICSLWCVFQSVHGQFYNPFAVMYQSFLCVGPLNHFWFFAALIIIYLFFPFFDYLYREQQRWFIVLVLGLLFLKGLIEIFNIRSVLLHKPLVLSTYYATYRPDFYLSFFAFGGILKRYGFGFLKYVRLWQLLLFWISMTAYEIIMTKVMLANNVLSERNVPAQGLQAFYDNPLTILLVLCCFGFALNCRLDRRQKGIASLSGTTMIVYIIHPFVRDIVGGFINVEMFGGSVLLLMLTYFVSTAAAMLITGLPYGKELFKI